MSCRTTCNDRRSLLWPAGGVCVCGGGGGGRGAVNLPVGPGHSPGGGQGGRAKHPGAFKILQLTVLKIGQNSPSCCILFNCFLANLRHCNA